MEECIVSHHLQQLTRTASDQELAPQGKYLILLRIDLMPVRSFVHVSQSKRQENKTLK